LSLLLDRLDFGVDIDVEELQERASTLEHFDDGFGGFDDAGHVEQHGAQCRCPGVQTG